MKVLVTGASGFIGTHLSRELADAGYDVVAVDHRGQDPRDLRVPGEMSSLLEGHAPDLVVHLAAKVGRLFGEDDVAETIADNAGMTATVAKEVGLYGARLVYASTSEVYGDLNGGVGYEGRPLRALPHNAYGLSKRWGEEACRLYAPDGLVVWRISMPYGPGLPAGRGRAAIVNMLYQALWRLPIPVHAGSERSWCWIGDTVRGLRMTLDRRGVWNVGRDDAAVPMSRVAEIACQLTGAPSSLIEEIPAPPRQTVVKRLATEKLRSIGWHPEVELEEGMARTLRDVEAMPPPDVLLTPDGSAVA